MRKIDKKETKSQTKTCKKCSSFSDLPAKKGRVEQICTPPLSPKIGFNVLFKKISSWINYFIMIRLVLAYFRYFSFTKNQPRVVIF